jgi:AraC-like DNA-binding protein/mannose-6-phosphate isomerase-like protein (cupin superfamily)
MSNKKSALQIMDSKPDISLMVYHYKFPDVCSHTWWHHHEELEIVYIPSGKGTLFIGNNNYKYQNGVIVLLNSNISHRSFDQGFEGLNYEEYVLQINPLQIEKMARIFPEFKGISRLVEVSKKGVVLPLNTESRYDQIFKNLLLATPFVRLLSFLNILQILSNTNFETLDSLPNININKHDNERITKVFEYISIHFKKEITTKEIANLLSFTESSFCRFFLKHTQKPFKRVLNEYRITHACKLLSNTDKTLEMIAYESGYGSQSFFNKMFKKVMGLTPYAYRTNMS